MLSADLERIGAARELHFDSQIWAHIVYWFLFHYCFISDVNSDDVLNALACAFLGRLASLLEQTYALQEDLKSVAGINPQDLSAGEIATSKEEQRKSFLLLRDDFIKVWGQKALELKPPLVPEHYLEFIPGVPIALPKELEGRGGRVVWSEGMFNRLQSKYQEAFNRFIYNSLGVPENSDSRTVARSPQRFHGRVGAGHGPAAARRSVHRRGNQAGSRQPVPVASVTDDVLHSRRDPARSISALPPAEPDDPDRQQHPAGAPGKDERPGRHHPGQPGREPEVG